MSRNLVLSDRLAEILRENLKHSTLSLDADEKYGHIYINIPKAGMKGFNNSDIEFLSSRINDFRRGRLKLRPKSLEHFLSSKKYEDDDEVRATVYIQDLIEIGELRKVDINGFKYWEFHGELLDPKEYTNMYKLDEDVYRTLFKEIGLLEIYDKFKDEILKNVNSVLNSSYVIARFSYEGVNFDIESKKFYARKTIFESTNRPFNTVSVWLEVNNPKSDDVFKAVEYMKYTELLLVEALDNVKSIIERSTGLTVEGDNLYGEVHVKDYRIEKFETKGRAMMNIGRTTLEVEAVNEYDRHKREYPHNSLQAIVFPRATTSVTITATEKSYYLYELMDIGAGLLDKPDNVFVSLNRSDKEVVLQIYNELPVYTFIYARRPFEVAKDFKGILSDLSDDILEALRDKTVKVKDRNGYSYSEVTVGKVGELLDKIGWKNVKDFDEAVLKLIALRLYVKLKDGVDIRDAILPIYDYLVANAITKGMDQDLLTEKVNDPMETVLDFIEKGKIKLAKVDGATKIYFKGKPLEEYMDQFLAYSVLGRLVFVAYALSRPEESARLRRATVAT